MTQPFWVGTSWKMNKTIAQALTYTGELQEADGMRDRRLQSFVVPPFTALATVCRELAHGPVLVGAQNMHWADTGAFTGEISPVMLKDCGASMVELGHSERREYFNETDEAINRKVKAALNHGLKPLICVGETAAEKRLGVAADTVVRQARIALSGVEPAALNRVLIAYEPVWAIGDKGSPASPEYAGWIHECLEKALPKLASGARVPILYGGSVNQDNCAAFAAVPSVAGLFIGRAAWEAADLLKIAETALAARF